MENIKKENKLKSIPKFNDHVNCQGHANYMLDLTYENQEERDQIIKCIDNYIK